MPLLVFIGDIAGIAGGMLIAQEQLGYLASHVHGPHGRRDPAENPAGGPVQGAGVCSFHRADRLPHGLSVTRDARSVGANTTSTVVQSLVAIIILNAIFAVMFVKLEI